MSKYTENFPNLSTYDFDTIMCQLRQVCGADPSGLINAQFLSRPTTAKDIALLLHITYQLFQSQVELQKQFVELYTFVKDFFENLDLQEEVNEWLDDALTSGKLMTLFEKFIPYVTPEMYGAKGDGIADDTQALQEACNTGRNVYLSKQYLVSSPIVSKSSLFGSGSVFYAYNTNQGRQGDLDNIFTFENVSNLFVRDITLDMKRDLSKTYGESSYGEWGYCLVLRGCKNIIIDGITAKNAQGDNIGIGQYNKIDSENISVINCHLENAYRNDISITGCKNAILKNNYIIKNSGYCGIIIEPDTDSNSNTENINVSDNTVMCIDRSGFTVSAYKHDGANLKNIIFKNNYLFKTGTTTGNAQYSLLFGGNIESLILSNNYIFANTVNNPQLINFGISVDKWAINVLLESNTFDTDYNTGYAPYAIYVCGHKNITFKNNNFHNVGIYFNDNPGNVIINNNEFNYNSSLSTVACGLLLNCVCNNFIFRNNIINTPAQFIFDKVGESTDVSNANNDTEHIKNMIIDSNYVIFTGASSLFCTLFRTKMYHIDNLMGALNGFGIQRVVRQRRVNTGVCNIGVGGYFTVYNNSDELPSNASDKSVCLLLNDDNYKFGFYDLANTRWCFQPKSGFSENVEV